jgi:glutaminyl-peptide cyclotransferase
MIFRYFVAPRKWLAVTAAVLVVWCPSILKAAQSLPQFDGAAALAYTSQFVSAGPRWVGSEGHARAEAYLQRQFAKDHIEKDTFLASTPAGNQQMTNYIVKFPGDKPGVIVFAGHYETNYPLRNTAYIGANDGGSSTGLLLQLAKSFQGRRLSGYSVWLVFFDGEEAVEEWSHSDSLYGSRHLAAKWESDGTLKRIKALIVADMIGDSDLHIDRDENSTPWLLDLVGRAAEKCGDRSYFFARGNRIEDDHLPFAERGVPVADIIDISYGPGNAYWHSPQDTMDKLSAKSLTIVGNVFLETVQLLDQR